MAPSKSSVLAPLLAAASAASSSSVVVAQQQQRPEPLHARPDYIGPRDRFWRHHRDQKTLVWKGKELYGTLEGCLFGDGTDGSLTDADRRALDEMASDPSSPNSPNKSIGKRILDTPDERFGNVVLVQVMNAIEPVQARAVQRLAHCIRSHIPEYFEVRAMYKEFNMDVDPGYGGNSPTHMMPFLGIFLPSVADTIIQTARFAYDAAGWAGITMRDKIAGVLTDDPTAIPSPDARWQRADAMPEPEFLGFRASEHLTYNDFPLLEQHHDGTDTSYTINFALSGPDDYEGGYLYVIDSNGEYSYFKPEKYSCAVFLGGHYYHGVTEIFGGRREMFSNEMWFNPDLPLGGTLW